MCNIVYQINVNLMRDLWVSGGKEPTEYQDQSLSNMNLIHSLTTDIWQIILPALKEGHSPRAKRVLSFRDFTLVLPPYGSIKVISVKECLQAIFLETVLSVNWSQIGKKHLDLVTTLHQTGVPPPQLSVGSFDVRAHLDHIYVL